MIYPSDSAAARLVAAQALAAKIIAAGVGDDPISVILVDLHIRDFDVVFCQRECVAFSDSVKLANAMSRLSMNARARVVLPTTATDADVLALLAVEGERVGP